MYLLNVLFCMFIFSCSEISSALIKPRCSDCVSILSCEAGLDFVRRLRHGDLPPQSRQTFLDAICGSDSNNPETPKVCCSAFPMQTTVSMGADIIEMHPNIGLLPTSCGDIDGSRISNGRIPKLYEFPWMTLIAYYNLSNEVEFRCGGSVINSRYILTAAHCVTNGRKFKKIAGVRIGDFDYSTQDDCQGDYENMICESSYQDIEVEEIIPHESFTAKPGDGDIALLRLKEDIVMTSNAAPICLPVSRDLRNTRLAGKNAIIAGWGLSKDTTTQSKASIPILTSDNCTHYYNNKHQQNSLMEKVFCAGDPLVDPCIGDSGGPLIVESDFNNQVRLVQYGINSFGFRRCGSQYPDVYTDVTKYMEWILDNIRA